MANRFQPGCNCCTCTIIDLHGSTGLFANREDRTPQEQNEFYSEDPSVLSLIPHPVSPGDFLFVLDAGETWTGKPITPPEWFRFIFSELRIAPASTVNDPAAINGTDFTVRFESVVDDIPNGDGFEYRTRGYLYVVENQRIPYFYFTLSRIGSDSVIEGFVRQTAVLAAGATNPGANITPYRVNLFNQNLRIGDIFSSWLDVRGVGAPSDFFIRTGFVDANLQGGTSPFEEYVSNGLSIPKGGADGYRVVLKNNAPFSVSFSRFLVEKIRGTDFAREPVTGQTETQNERCVISNGVHMSAAITTPQPYRAEVSGIGTAEPTIDFAVFPTTYWANLRSPTRLTEMNRSYPGPGTNWLIFGPENGYDFSTSQTWNHGIGFRSSMQWSGADSMPDGSPAYRATVSLTFLHYVPFQSETVVATSNENGVFPFDFQFQDFLNFFLSRQWRNTVSARSGTVGPPPSFNILSNGVLSFGFFEMPYLTFPGESIARTRVLPPNAQFGGVQFTTLADASTNKSISWQVRIPYVIAESNWSFELRSSDTPGTVRDGVLIDARSQNFSYPIVYAETVNYSDSFVQKPAGLYDTASYSKTCTIASNPHSQTTLRVSKANVYP